MCPLFFCHFHAHVGVCVSLSERVFICMYMWICVYSCMCVHCYFLYDRERKICVYSLVACYPGSGRRTVILHPPTPVDAPLSLKRSMTMMITAKRPRADGSLVYPLSARVTFCHSGAWLRRSFDGLERKLNFTGHRGRVCFCSSSV